MMVVLVGSLFAREPLTAHFCVTSFDETEDNFDLGLRAVKKINPDKTWKWPDSLTCGYPAWSNKLVFSYKGKQINLKGAYEGTLNKSGCEECSDFERVQKRAVISPSIGELNTGKGDCLCRNEKKIDSTSVKNFYGKKFKADWETTFSCSCPSYESITLKTKLNVVIDGPCPSEKKVEESEIVLVPDSVGQNSLNNVLTRLFGCIGEVCSSEEPKEDTVLAEGVFPCYYNNADEKHHPINSYGSTKRMNMIDKPEASEESLECFEVDGKRYLVFGSNVPNQFYSEDVHYGKFTRTYCYENFNGFKEMKKRETPFYSCETKLTSPKGCKAKEHGLDFVMNGKGEFSGWDRKALWLYVRLREAKDAVSFMDSLKYGELEKEILLPANVSKKTVQKLGDEAARKTAGMSFYKGTRRVRYEKFGKNQLNSMKDALDKCNAWDNR